MTREEIAPKLEEATKEFTDYILSLSKEEFEYSYNDKWTAGQQMDHLYKSAMLLPKAYSVPGLLLRYKFGKANRPSRSYEKLVERYHEKLQLGGKSPARFAPPPILYEMRQEQAERLIKTIKKLSGLVIRYNEKKLDKYILPHPLLGKLTLREMLYFTIYHTGHHLRKTQENLHHQAQNSN